MGRGLDLEILDHEGREKKKEGKEYEVKKLCNFILIVVKNI